MGYGLSALFAKKVLARIDGSYTIGLGHIYRMRTLALALRDAGCYVAFLTLENEVANQLLSSTGLTCYVFQRDTYNSTLQEAVQKQRPDLIIQDVLEISADQMETIHQLTTAKIINFDDVGAGLATANVVINSIVFHWNKYKPNESRARLVEGPKYMILQPEIGNYVNRDKKIPAKAEHVLLAFGGTDTYFVTERVLKAINNINGDLNVKINLGPGSKMTPCLEEVVKSSTHQVEILHSVPNLLGEFFQADLVVCGGGNMLYELAALGIPSVSIATEAHEIFNVDYWASVGTTVSLGWREDLILAQVSEAISNLLFEKQRRFKMSLIGKKTVDGLGLSRVLKIIEETMI